MRSQARGTCEMADEKKLIDAVWANETNVSVYVFEAANDRRVIEIHGVNEGGYEYVQFAATIEKHNRDNLARCIALPQPPAKSCHLSEVFRVVEGALRGDSEKVKAYAGLLADKLEEDGEENSARRLRQIIEGKAGARIVAREGGN